MDKSEALTSLGYQELSSKQKPGFDKPIIWTFGGVKARTIQSRLQLEELPDGIIVENGIISPKGTVLKPTCSEVNIQFKPIIITCSNTTIQVDGALKSSGERSEMTQGHKKGYMITTGNIFTQREYFDDWVTKLLNKTSQR